MRPMIIALAAIAAVLTASASPTQPKPIKKMHVPPSLGSIRPIARAAAGANHILLANVNSAIPDEVFSRVATFVASRLQVNIWTNALPTVDLDMVKGKTTLAVFFEDSDGKYPFLAAPGSWCRVNVRGLKIDKPDAQTLVDRYAKNMIKGIAYAACAGASLDKHSSTYFDSFDLKKLDETGITISPESYFPMLETLRVIGGNEILSPAHD